MENYQGVTKDTRTALAKSKDFKHSEIATTSSPVTWTENFPIPNYSIRSQASSGSCLHQSICKAIEIMTGKIYSATPTYQLRAPKPASGDFPQNAAEVMRKNGTVLETVTPSQNMTDEQMDSTQVATTTRYKPSGYVFLDNPKDIDTLAQIVKDRRHLVLCFASSWEEYKIHPQDNIIGYVPDAQTTFGHAVCVIGYTLHNGTKMLAVDNSHGNAYEAGDTQLLTEEFVKNRAYSAFYLLPEVEVKLPTFSFFKDLKMGDKGTDVENLQKTLQHLGFMPTGLPLSYFGNITVQAVMKFQKANNLPQVGKVGPQTRAVLNKLVSKPNYFTEYSLWFKSFWK